MEQFLDQIATFPDRLKQIRETLLTNVIFLGQVPAPTFQEKERCAVFLERMAQSGVDECTTDAYGNPIGVIRGADSSKPPIFVVAHMDSAYNSDVDHNYVIKRDIVTGAGVLDNALGIGLLVTLPEIIRILGLRFDSDIVLAGVIQSIGTGNLRGVRHLLKHWTGPIRGAIVVEGGDVGRLNYYSYGMVRGEIRCRSTAAVDWGGQPAPNAILIANEVINQVLRLRLPQHPRSMIVFGRIKGGLKHGRTARSAKLGFEIRSDSDAMVRTLSSDIQDIVEGIRHEYEVDLRFKTISNISSSRLEYRHPLVKSVVAVMNKLKLKPFSEANESELSIFLARRIPAVTLGISRNASELPDDSTMEIGPMFQGVAQVVGVLKAIDQGVCDEQ